MRINIANVWNVKMHMKSSKLTNGTKAHIHNIVRTIWRAKTEREKRDKKTLLFLNTNNNT